MNKNPATASISKNPHGRRARRAQWLRDVATLVAAHARFGTIANENAAASLRARKDARRLRRQAVARAARSAKIALGPR